MFDNLNDSVSKLNALLTVKGEKIAQGYYDHCRDARYLLKLIADEAKDLRKQLSKLVVERKAMKKSERNIKQK